MVKQQKLDLTIPDREDLESARASIKLLKAETTNAGWTLTSRYRKKQRKFYFTASIKIDEGMGTVVRNPHREIRTLISKHFPEAYVTSGGGGWGDGTYEFTFAERADRDACDKPKFDSTSW